MKHEMHKIQKAVEEHKKGIVKAERDKQILLGVETLKQQSVEQERCRIYNEMIEKIKQINGRSGIEYKRKMQEISDRNIESVIMILYT